MSGGQRRRANYDLCSARSLTTTAAQYTDYGAADSLQRTLRTTNELTEVLLASDEVVYSTLDAESKVFTLPADVPPGKQILLYSQTTGPKEFTVGAPLGTGIVSPQTPGTVVPAVTIDKFCGRFTYSGDGVWFETGRCPLDEVPTFVTTWQQTPANLVLTLPFDGTYSVSVDFGEGGGFEAATSSPPTHTYATGTAVRTVRVLFLSGMVPDFSMQQDPSPSRTMTLLTVAQWGSVRLAGAGLWFAGVDTLTAITADDAPDFSAATSFMQAFQNCASLTTIAQDGLDSWMIPSGLSMSSAFSTCPLTGMTFGANMFNAPTSCQLMFGTADDDETLPGFNAAFASGIAIPATCSVQSMFAGCSGFNQVPPGLSTTAGRTSFRSVFDRCSAFNQPLPASWKAATTTQNITDYVRVFRQCAAFDQDLGAFFVQAAATNLTDMLRQCTSFTNGGSDSIGSWNVSNVQAFDFMLLQVPFDINLLGPGKWTLEGATALLAMFANCPNFNNGGVTMDLNFGTTDRSIDATSMFAACTALTDAVAFGGTTTLPTGGGASISFAAMYADCTNAAFTGANIPADFINDRVTTLGGTFSGCPNFVGSAAMTSWDVSGVTTFHTAYAEGTFYNTPFNRPVMEQTAWGGKMTLAQNTRLMFATSSAFTNGGQPVYWHPSYGTTGSPQPVAAMFRNCALGAVDMDFGTGDPSSVQGAFIFVGLFAGTGTVTADFTGCGVSRFVPATWVVTWAAGAKAAFEASVIYWDNATDHPAQGSLTSPETWASLSGAAQTAITNLIAQGWTITPHP